MKQIPRGVAADSSTDTALQAGLQHHQQGRLREAEAAYLRVLRTTAGHPDALHLLGVLAHQAGRHQAAVELIGKAVAANPTSAVFHSNLGNALQALGRLETASESYRRAVALKPDFADAHNNLGSALLRLGQTEEAIACLRRCVAIRPDYAGAHYNLATALKVGNRLDEAMEHYASALRLNPDLFGAHINLGNVLKQLDRIEEAVACYRRALACQPRNADAHYDLGLALRDLGHAQEAQESFRQSIACEAGNALAHHELGSMLRDSGRLDEAQACYRRAIELRPDFVPASINLGVLLHGRGDLDAAADCYRQALSHQPANEIAHCNLGTTLQAMHRLEEAAASFRAALRLKPAFPEALYNLGNTLVAQGQPGAAAECYAKALGLKPDSADIRNNLANVLQSQGKLGAAAEHFNHVLARDPRSAEAHNNLGNVLKHQVRLDEAIAAYRRALGIKPDYAEAHSNLLFAMSSHPGLTPRECLAEARRYGQKVTALARAYTQWKARGWKPGERLRVGLVSGDLKAHPVGYFLESILAHLDVRRIELFAYSTKPQEDELTARIRPRFAAWRQLAGLGDAAAAAAIHEDGLHILLDLAGHTAFNRLPVFAWKPAPVQASWLGYFATTGVPAMDYVLADAVSVPASHQAQFTERVWNLPDTRLCFTPPHGAPEVTPLPALQRGHVTFGCFQSLSKIGDEVLAVWGRILQALPQARLRVQNRQMSCEATRRELQARLARSGIAGERVTICAPTSREEYLQAHAQVDMILDTFPYPGGTTTCEALWMGVPTLTLAGDTMLSRQGASLLASAGLPRWVAGSQDEYVDAAVRHARQPGELAQLRAGLREQVQASPLFDAARFAVNLEDALEQMWRECGRLTASNQELG